MPPKRKAAVVTVEKVEEIDGSGDAKKTKTTKRGAVAEPAKTSRATKKTVSHDEPEEMPIKDVKEKVAKDTKKTKKADKPKETTDETSKTDDKDIKKTKKAAEPEEASEEATNKTNAKDTKKNKKAAEPKEKKEPVKTSSRATKKPVSYNEAEEKPKKVVKEKVAKVDKKIKNAAEPKEASDELKNKTETHWDEVKFTTNKKNNKGESANLTITTWNVDGLRAWLKKGGLSILDACKPDILCLQETKVGDDKLPEEVKNVAGYHTHWCASQKTGYAGVGLLTREKPISCCYGIGDEEQDEDGRCIIAEFEGFYVVAVYVPNAGRKLVTLPRRLEWNEAFKSRVLELNKKKPVIVCGDMNVAHQEVDLANPKTNKKNAGFTQEERDGMTDLLAGGYVDVHRSLYPDQRDVYTFWTYLSNSRAKNVGWRLDYFLVHESLMDNVCDIITHKNVFGSDHCPLTLFINI
ncbi:unnamed protein product [Brassicogethes aeneus]|uniref:DNA-(apurinic or apyrimidinic site) endonuclease n=1 Tax=Brassicogethes aeneus TaxID=1431903 RepID=A0A9P0FRU3_BRAAE|nr:unnamed protein product [Brassicogethes aeneus]